MKDVRVPASNLLGPEGDAFDAISLPMRRTEDAIFAASKAGSIRHILKNICIEAPALAQDKDRLSELGKLAAASSGLSDLAFRGAELLDMDSTANTGAVGAISAAAREWASSLYERINALIEISGLTPSPVLAATHRDLGKTLGIARSAYLIEAHRRGSTFFERTMENKTS